MTAIRRTRAGIVLAALLLLAAGAAAERDVDGLEELIPHAETSLERLRWLATPWTWPDARDKSDPPPLAPVRNCAEWEPCTGVLVRYPLGLPYDLLCDLDDDVVLHVVVSSAYLASAQSNLAAHGVDMGRVEFLVKPNDSIWVRDYGPWFVFDGAGQLSVIDHTYNRPWRPNDNLIPVHFADQQGLPVHSHDMYHTGGNYMTDGAHVSSSTRLVYDEAASVNGMTPTEVDGLMLDYYGVERYEVLDDIETGGIHHIDTWAKFLDEETVLVKEVWPEHHTHATLEQRATLLASLPASTGRQYQVHRVYCFDIGGDRPAAYTNSLILNDGIYVPLFGDPIHDDAALAAYAAAAPGFLVRGYAYSGFLTDDALHCRAKGVMDRGMLRLEHVPLRDTHEGAVGITVRVTAHSGADLTSLDLHYRRDGGAWQVMPLASSPKSSYEAEIPAPASDPSTVDYYVLAADASGRQEGLPRVAPAHWFSFTQRPLISALGRDGRGPALRVENVYPNPANPGTRFRFELKYAAPVRLEVLDMRGRRVRTLLAAECPAGVTEVAWDGCDGRGRAVPAGRYHFRLRAAGLVYTRPATIVK